MVELKDTIHVDTDIHLSFWDRIKVLLGWKFSLNSVTYCENLPGKVYSKVEIKIYRIHKLLHGSGYIHQGEEVIINDSEGKGRIKA